MGSVLVVDDDPDNILIVRTALERAGHSVHTTLDPEEAVALATASGAEAIVLDVMMPGRSGHQVLEDLRAFERTRDVPILFVSALADGAARVKGLRLGAEDYLGKPFDADELVIRVERLIERRSERAGTMRASLARIQKRIEGGESIGEASLGRYQVIEVLGVGGMGTVFRGFDPKLKRSVAIKTIRLDANELTGYALADLVRSLLDEAVTVAKFSHPNIVSIYDADEQEDAAFIVMEFVDGFTMESALRRGPIPAPRSVPLATGVARGLAAAHAHKVLHHDVKPANVLLGGDGSIKVGDFGYAGLITSAVKDAKKIFGTPGYLPPEAITGKGYDERGDLFGLGVILYRCLTGVRLFKGDSQEETMRKTYHDTVVPPSRHDPSVPPAVEALVMSLLEKDPAARPAQAAEVAAELHALSVLNDWEWAPPAAGVAPRDYEMGTSRSCVVRTLFYDSDKLDQAG